jgi:predicted enzyme related to lactoylglutathione lyase
MLDAAHILHHVRPPEARRLTASAVSFGAVGGHTSQMSAVIANPVVHLELRTENLARACAFYTQLFEWRAETIHSNGSSYLALELGEAIDGGIAEHQSGRAVWLPYVEVGDIAKATERAQRAGAAVLLEPREGPAGWRSVLAPPAGAEIALWQPKR